MQKQKKKKTVQNIKAKADRTFPKLLGRPESNIVLTLGTVQNLEFFYDFFHTVSC